MAHPLLHDSSLGEERAEGRGCDGGNEQSVGLETSHCKDGRGGERGRLLVFLWFFFCCSCCSFLLRCWVGGAALINLNFRCFFNGLGCSRCSGETNQLAKEVQEEDSSNEDNRDLEGLIGGDLDTLFTLTSKTVQVVVCTSVNLSSHHDLLLLRHF